MKKKVYALLAFFGLIIPYTQFVPWTNENGFDVFAMVSAMFANQIAAGIALDALTAAVVLVVFIAIEHKRRPIPYAWVPVCSIFLVGIAFAFPLYLYLRERADEKNSLSVQS